MLRVSITTCLAILMAVASAPAQGRRDRIEQELLEKQRRMREGKMVRANVRVTVRLNNGCRVRGVVKGGRLIERLDEREFVEARTKGPDAGLRVWYFDDTNSYIFLPYESIAHYRIGEKLTDEEVQAIAERIDENRKRAELRREQQLAAKRDGQEPAPGGTAGGPPSSEPPKSKLTPAQQKLLADFPPDQGWSLDRLQQIERRKITLDVFPNAREKTFIESFAQWNEAFEIWQAEQEAQREAPQQSPPAEPPAPAPVPKPGG